MANGRKVYGEDKTVDGKDADKPCPDCGCLHKIHKFAAAEVVKICRNCGYKFYD